MELRHYAIALTAAGMNATWHPVDEQFDLERIDVSVKVNGFDEPLLIQVTQPPVAEWAQKGLDLIQIYAPIPVQLTQDELDSMAYEIIYANELSPLIGFSVRVEESFLYFRTLLLIPPGEIGFTVAIEGVSRTHFALDIHAADLIRSAREA